MFHYLFTNDLRISSLDETMKSIANMIIQGTVPSAKEDKGTNNNAMTLGFYFNLTERSNCSYEAANGNIRKVVLNFIKKFQFPNLRTIKSFEDCKRDGIQLVPMRTILKMLYIIYINDGDSGYLTKEEIREFIFYNEDVAKVRNPNIVEVYTQIKKFRINNEKPFSIVDCDKREWHQEDRQLREMIKILLWSGCVIEFEKNKYRIKHINLSNEEKGEIFDIITSNDFWEGDDAESYSEYMDINAEKHDRNVYSKTIRKKIDTSNNRLIYGAPGTGKSNLLKKDIEKYNIDENNYERVTFYPDYSYGQFVGMYKPISDGKDIKYDFVAGPFLRLLTKALKSKEDGTNEDFVLIVEEINRANAAYVFGDMFQLLDRDENGKSEYDISISKDMEQFFAKDENPNVSKLYLPDNFYIWATMNSGDQGVMPLDSAFKRRFEDYKLVGIDENEDAIKGIRVNINGIGNVEWNDFRKALNSYLIETFNVKEDKLIGPFFIKTKVLKDPVMFDRAFQDKLLMYLAEDILNHNKQRLFGTNSLSKIKGNYKSGKVFTENFWTEIIDSDISEIKLHDIEVEQS